jgi:hypothetical protein
MENQHPTQPTPEQRERIDQILGRQRSLPLPRGIQASRMHRSATFTREDGAILRLEVGDREYFLGSHKLDRLIRETIDQSDRGFFFLILTQYHRNGETVKRQEIIEHGTRIGDVQYELDKLDRAFKTAILFCEGDE